jgi:hypothetical protein
MANIRPVRVKFGTLSVPMWHELQFMPVWRAKLGMAWVSRDTRARPAIPIAAAAIDFQARITFFLPRIVLIAASRP